LRVADRAIHAYWRMRERYPTVAKMTVPAHDLVRVGTLDPERGVIRDEFDARTALLAWLGIEDVPGDRRILSLQRELCVLAIRLIGGGCTPARAPRDAGRRSAVVNGSA
jgi:hypothetical protein